MRRSVPTWRCSSAELTQLELDEQVDAVFSNAVFHWIPTTTPCSRACSPRYGPAAGLRSSAAATATSAPTTTQLHEICAEPPFAEYLGDWEGPWNFAGPGATALKLDAAGFTDVRCWLEHEGVVPDEPDHFIRSVCLGHHLERLPEELREELVQRSMERAGSPLTLDYVRLNMDARKPQ